MQIILLERIGRLGQMGDVVKVRDGFARNFLLPQGKALRATKENMSRFENQRAQLEANNLQRKQEAEAVAVKLGGLRVTVIRQAGDTGQLYGSVSTRDVADAVTAGGFTIDRVQILLDRPIKNLGLHEVRVSLHPEVEIKVVVNVARTEEEATRQAAGEDVIKVHDEYAADYAAEQAAIAAEALFEAGAEAEREE
jgi:large subunit ribosomal protein L9